MLITAEGLKERELARRPFPAYGWEVGQVDIFGVPKFVKNAKDSRMVDIGLLPSAAMFEEFTSMKIKYDPKYERPYRPIHEDGYPYDFGKSIEENLTEYYKAYSEQNPGRFAKTGLAEDKLPLSAYLDVFRDYAKMFMEKRITLPLYTDEVYNINLPTFKGGTLAHNGVDEKGRKIPTAWAKFRKFEEFMWYNFTYPEFEAKNPNLTDEMKKEAIKPLLQERPITKVMDKIVLPIFAYICDSKTNIKMEGTKLPLFPKRLECSSKFHGKMLDKLCEKGVDSLYDLLELKIKHPHRDGERAKMQSGADVEIAQVPTPEQRPSQLDPEYLKNYADWFLSFDFDPNYVESKVWAFTPHTEKEVLEHTKSWIAEMSKLLNDEQKKEHEDLFKLYTEVMSPEDIKSITGTQTQQFVAHSPVGEVAATSSGPVGLGAQEQVNQGIQTGGGLNLANLGQTTGGGIQLGGMQLNQQ